VSSAPHAFSFKSIGASPPFHPPPTCRDLLRRLATTASSLPPPGATASTCLRRPSSCHHVGEFHRSNLAQRTPLTLRVLPSSTLEHLGHWQVAGARATTGALRVVTGPGALARRTRHLGPVVAIPVQAGPVWPLVARQPETAVSLVGPRSWARLGLYCSAISNFRISYSFNYF
jgi:hypothetical protein